MRDILTGWVKDLSSEESAYRFVLRAFTGPFLE